MCWLCCFQFYTKINCQITVVHNKYMEEEMTKYEIITTILSTIAILVSIGIPLIKWLWNTYIVKAKITFHQIGQATLFFNKSGSYIRINGVVESRRKASIIKNVSLTLTRETDGITKKLSWCYLISPVTQTLLGNLLQQAQEGAHPFRVEANSIACAFIEFGDPYKASDIKIQKICTKIDSLITQLKSKSSFCEAFDALSKQPEYLESKNKVLENNYWDIGKYTANIDIEYNNNKKESFSYEFSLSEQNYEELLCNADEILIIQLKEFYKERLLFQSPTVELIDKNNK